MQNSDSQEKQVLPAFYYFHYSVRTDRKILFLLSRKTFAFFIIFIITVGLTEKLSLLLSRKMLAIRPL